MSRKKSANILEMLKNQGQNTINCPACDLKVQKSKLNIHLDSECPSANAKFEKSSQFSDNVKQAKDSGEDRVEATVKIKSEISNGVKKMLQRSGPIVNTCAPWRTKSVKRKFSETEKSDNELKRSDIKKETTDPDSTDQPKAPETRINFAPYYLTNFKHIVDKVGDDEFHKHLFDTSDCSCISCFQSFSNGGQKLYVRLFQRKYKWLRPMNINYPEIGTDLTEFLNELVAEKFLETGLANLELKSALDLLTLPEIKMLSKQFQINSSGLGKSEISQLLIKHGQQHKSLFCASDKNAVSNAILQKVKQVMGPCYRLTLEPKRLFSRLLTVFFLPTMAEDDEEAAGGQQQQLFTLLQVNKGEVKFPNYQIHRSCVIFEKREDLVRYEMARQLENDILNAVETKKFELGKELYRNAEHEMQHLKTTCQRDIDLPPFLRRFTASHVYIRCLNQGVEVLQKLRQYEEAVDLLHRLLNQKVYGQDRRGKWYDRIALNLEQHLKKPDKAAEAIKEGLKDDQVRVGNRLALLYRAQRITLAKHSNEELMEFVGELASITEAPKVTIKGSLLPHPIPGRRHIFVSSNISECSTGEEVTVLSVENVAIEHYKKDGFSEGLHGEGATFISLYTLLFWDIIYDYNIPDVFISPHQAHPLDLNCASFYSSREKQITAHLDALRNYSEQEFIETCKTSWTAHYGESSLVSWDLFTGLEQVEGLLTCFVNSVLVGICERLSKDFRFTRSGVPDLVVWNPETKLLKIVEVKGPGDKLSPKQILWLDYLLKLGGDAEVCLVEAVGSKKLRR